MRLIKQNSTGNYREYVNDDGFRMLKSYDVVVAKYTNNGVVLDEEYWNYSVTTSKHVGQFLGERPYEIKKMVKNGIISLQNLN